MLKLIGSDVKMMKLDRKKSNKICAILLAGALSFPILGCSNQNKNQKPHERFSYSVAAGELYITDNETDNKFILCDEYHDNLKEEQSPIKDKVYYISSNELIFIVFLTVGAALYCITVPFYNQYDFICTEIKNMSDEEFDKLCEKEDNNEHFVKKIKNIRNGKTSKIKYK